MQETNWKQLEKHLLLFYVFPVHAVPNYKYSTLTCHAVLSARTEGFGQPLMFNILHCNKLIGYGEI